MIAATSHKDKLQPPPSLLKNVGDSACVVASELLHVETL